jgi:geranylgeranyl reductase family protein
MPSFDFLIAGGGPAGCAAAYDLAQAGHRVLLLDRRTFPRHKACACGLTRKTLKALRYQVNPVVERVSNEIVLQRATPPHTIAEKSAEVRVRTRTPICAMAERQRFDAFCLEQTLASGTKNGGVTLRKIESIAALRDLATHIELDVVILLNGHEHTETLTAPALIGADGSNSQTRRLAEASAQSPAGVQRSVAAWFTRGFALEALVSYTALPTPLPAGDHPHDLVFDFSPIPGGYGWLFPKGDHINIGVGAFAPNDGTDLKQVTRKLLETYSTGKLGTTALPNITGQHLGMGGHAYVPHGRVLLVGDAAGLVDPLTGEGIHSAIVSGQAAAAAILDTLAPKPCTQDPAVAYARHLAPLQQTLAFSHRAAAAFYREPERGFKAMRIPIVRQLILKTYVDGLPHTKLLTTLAKLV